MVAEEGVDMVVVREGWETAEEGMVLVELEEGPAEEGPGVVGAAGLAAPVDGENEAANGVAVTPPEVEVTVDEDIRPGVRDSAVVVVVEEEVVGAGVRGLSCDEQDEDGGGDWEQEVVSKGNNGDACKWVRMGLGKW